jgi:ABC-type proline/glycine betaine transport system permease subunit
VSKRGRVLSFGFAAALVIAGGLCAAFVSGVTGEVLTIVLIAAGLGGALLLIFLEVGFDEERELARDEERRRAPKRQVLEGKASSQRSRWPRRPG